MKALQIVFLSIILTGCSNMMAGYYRQLDGKKRTSPSPRHRTAKKTHSYFKTSADTKQLLPTTKRFYSMQQQKRKERVTAKNFFESENKANLWATPGSTNLFTANSSITSGDIVIINVLGDLKSDIANELKRAFPLKKRIKKHGTLSQKNQVPSPSTVDETNTIANKIYDRISSIVVDSISDDYVTIKGRKELLYKNKKHSVEIQALINKKDITPNSYIKSDSIIEKKITVLY